MLVGAAIKDGYIKDVNDPVTAYLPVLKGTSYDGVTIRQVLQMSSGVAWNEDYTDPKSDVARIGAVAAQGGSLGLVTYMGALPRVVPPGSKFNYNTGETHLIGAIVRAAVGNNLSSYASQKIWSKFAMESNGFWMLADEYGAEHAGCCMSATLRDYGRIGLLALRKGVLRRVRRGARRLLYECDAARLRAHRSARSAQGRSPTSTARSTPAAV